MRKEYDLRALKVKRRGVMTGLKPIAARESDPKVPEATRNPASERIQRAHRQARRFHQ